MRCAVRRHRKGRRAYTGLADVGTATIRECVQIVGWIAGSVSLPVIMDGDTGHGGIMAVRRMVRECIRTGIAGVRIDDQAIEGKCRTQSASVEVVPPDQAIARYRAVVDMKTNSIRTLSLWRSASRAMRLTAGTAPFAGL
jgi:methylisocitrate lyase